MGVKKEKGIETRISLVGKGENQRKKGEKKVKGEARVRNGERRNALNRVGGQKKQKNERGLKG